MLTTLYMSPLQTWLQAPAQMQDSLTPKSKIFEDARARRCYPLFWDDMAQSPKLRHGEVFLGRACRCTVHGWLELLLRGAFGCRRAHTRSPHLRSGAVQGLGDVRQRHGPTMLAPAGGLEAVCVLVEGSNPNSVMMVSWSIGNLMPSLSLFSVDETAAAVVVSVMRSSSAADECPKELSSPCRRPRSVTHCRDCCPHRLVHVDDYVCADSETSVSRAFEEMWEEIGNLEDAAGGVVNIAPGGTEEIVDIAGGTG